ncbi:hypothetical protein [Chromobacterium violaceum]|uniref:hypothetical protein n=1 Tax=Chromobacterium violaceum TaxID=536 RepID=UPI001CE0AF4E|nr:hypothetical protein [Chromobacterium violaceum]
MDVVTPPIIFTPDNEPYLGRTLLMHFDQMISSILELNASLAPTSHHRTLTDCQHMACQVIAQALSITLSIRELIRQGYLFGAHVLLRTVVERAILLLYFHYLPSEIKKWNQGWHTREGAPSLAKMMEAIQKQQSSDSIIPGNKLTETMNSLLHAKPDSAPWNMVSLSEGKAGHAVSKILNRPGLCDELCADIIPWIVIIQAMMTTYFPPPTKTPDAS